MDPTSTFGKEDGQEKKSNSYKKIRLSVVLGGGKWKKREIQRWEKGEKQKGKMKVLGSGN